MYDTHPKCEKLNAFSILCNFCNNTEAKVSKDAVNTPPIFTLKILLPRCNKNNIVFCMPKDDTYHWILYLWRNGGIDKGTDNMKSIKINYPNKTMNINGHIYNIKYLDISYAVKNM